MDFRSLAAYTRWMLARPLRLLDLPALPVSLITLADDARPGGGVTALVLHRSGQYQTELFLMHPAASETTVPLHRHPHVDSMEYFLTTGVQFSKNNHQVTAQEAIGKPSWAGALMSVRHKDWHGAAVGADGGAFLSIQKWRDGVPPSSVTLDWVGPDHVAHSASG